MAIQPGVEVGPGIAASVDFVMSPRERGFFEKLLSGAELILDVLNLYERVRGDGGGARPGAEPGNLSRVGA